MTKKAGLQCFGFFLIGLPWEKISNIEETKKHIYELDCEFLELHIAVPYFGTNLYAEINKENLLDDTPLGKDYFNKPTKGTKFLTSSELSSFRKSLLFKYHARPSYIGKKILYGANDIRKLKNYFKYGSKLIKNIIT